MRALISLALVLGAAGLALSVVALAGEGGQQSRELKLGLAEKEDVFKFSDVAPKARSEEDISAGDSFVFSGDVSGERKGRLAGACEVADKGEPTCHATYTFDDGQITVAGVPVGPCVPVPEAVGRRTGPTMVGVAVGLAAGGSEARPRSVVTVPASIM